MSIIKRMRKQKAVYWLPLGFDDFGQPLLYSFGNQETGPFEIDCRWEDKVVQFLNKEGRLQLSRSVVYTDRVVALGGVLALGRIGDMVSATDPFANNAWEVMRFDSLPNLRNTETLYTAYL